MATLSEIRGRLLDQVEGDPAPTTDLVRRVNGFIDEAVQKIGTDAPYLFHEEQLRFRLEPGYESVDTTDTLSVLAQTSPTRTLNEVVATNVTAESLTPTNRAIPGDRTWDARDIDLVSAATNTVVHRSRIRTIQNVDAGGTYSFITLETPVDTEAIGTGPWEYRIYSRAHWLPANVVEWRSGHLLDGNTTHELDVIGQSRAEDRWLADEYDVTAQGIPRYLFRRGFFQLRGPARACAVAEGDDTDADERWLGPEPGGKFQYVFTYSWGKRSSEYRADGIANDADNGEVYDVTVAHLDANWQGSVPWDNRRKTPKYESSPSPVSAEITTEVMDNAADWAGAIKLTFPHIGYAQGFGFIGATGNNDSSAFGRGQSAGSSGIHVRVYRRRLTEDFAEYASLGGTTKQAGSRIGAGSSTTDILSRLEFDNSFYLLAELPLEQLQQGVWFDRGEITPDYSVRLPDINGYQGVRFYPVPDQAYDISVRVLRAPPHLENDTDAPRLPSTATQLIIEAAKILYYEHLREPGMADRAEMKYKEHLERLGRRFGDLRPEHKPLFRRAARSSKYRRDGYRRTTRYTNN